MVGVPGDEPVVAVGDQVGGPLAGGLVLPVAPLVQGQRADRHPRAPGQDGHQGGDHEQVRDRAVAEDLGPVHPHVGVRVPGPERRELGNPDQDQDHERDRDQPPQVAAQLAVDEPGADEGREVGRVRHLVRAVDPAAAEELDPGDDLPDDVVTHGGVQRVARVAEAVVRVELVAVFHPDLLAVGQDQVRGQAQPGPGHLPHRVRRLDVPGQVGVVVADGVDDLPAARGHVQQRRAQVLVRAQDVGGRRPGGAEQLDHVPGQDHGGRPGFLGEMARQHLAGPPRDVRPDRGEVQVTDRDHLDVGRNVHLEQVGDVGTRGGHGGACLYLRGLSRSGWLVRSYHVHSPAPSYGMRPREEFTAPTSGVGMGEG